MSISAKLVMELRQKTGLGMMDCKRALQATDGNIEAAITKLREDGALKAEKRSSKAAAEGAVLTASNDTAAVIAEINCQTDFVGRDEGFLAFAKAAAEAALALNTDDATTILASQANGFEGTLGEWRTQLVTSLGENIQLRRISLRSSDNGVGHYCHRNRIGVLVELDQNNAELARDIALHIAAINPQCIAPENVNPELIEKEKAIFTEQAKQSGKPDNIIAKMVDGRVNKYLKEISLVSQPFVKDPDTSIADLLAKNGGATVKHFARFELGDGIEIETADFAEEVKAQVAASKKG